MRHGRRAAVLAAVILATPVLTASPLRAQGIGVNAHSGCNSGRFEAVIADPCADGSSVWYSPAALAFEPSVVTVGGTIIRNSSTFTFNADPNTVYKRGPSNPLAPHGWVNYRGGERWAVGIGGWAPYGLTLVWPTTFPGRFGGYDNTVKAFYVQPTVAYQLVPKRLAVAAGADVVFGIMDISMREDVATQVVPDPRLPAGTTFNNFGIPLGTDFANLQLKGNATGFTGHFAALLKVNDRISLGARYLMGAKVKIDNGTATFTQVATGRVLPVGNPFIPGGGSQPLDALFASKFLTDSLLHTQTVKAEITMPAMAVVGLAVKVIPSVSVSADYQWTQWSKWDSVALHFTNPPSKPAVQQLYLMNQNTTTIRVGANWVASKALQLRGGWGWNNAAETDIAVSPLLPEAKRNYYALGAGYDLNKAFRLDAFWQNVQQAARQGRLYPLASTQCGGHLCTGSDVNVGVYTNTANLFGASVSYTFGHIR